MSDNRSSATNPNQPPAAAGKKPYQPPQLLVHGSVAELTQISGTGTADKISGSVIDPG